MKWILYLGIQTRYNIWIRNHKRMCLCCLEFPYLASNWKGKILKQKNYIQVDKCFLFFVFCFSSDLQPPFVKNEALCLLHPTPRLSLSPSRR